MDLRKQILKEKGLLVNRPTHTEGLHLVTREQSQIRQVVEHHFGKELKDILNSPEARSLSVRDLQRYLSFPGMRISKSTAHNWRREYSE